MTNSHINREIWKAQEAYGFSLINQAYKDFHTWSPRRSYEYNIKRGKGFSRKTKFYTCSICGKRICELDSLRTPAYIRYRQHYWRCVDKEIEEFANQLNDNSVFSFSKLRQKNIEV